MRRRLFIPIAVVVLLLILAVGGRRQGNIQPAEYGASVRSVAERSDPDGSPIAMPASRSAHPMERHYDDPIELFLAGEMRPLRRSAAAIEEATVSTLTLRP